MALRCAMSAGSRIVRITDWMRSPRVYSVRNMARPRHQLGNLPAETTSFVGRRRELAEIRKKLSTSRLVSLVGPGGVGKTRLALRAAADLARGFADGAWLVELAEVHDGALVADAVLAAFDLRNQAAVTPMQILVSQLEDKQVLLVLDNCEHLIDAAARLVIGVLRAAPRSARRSADRGGSGRCSTRTRTSAPAVRAATVWRC